MKFTSPVVSITYFDANNFTRFIKKQLELEEEAREALPYVMT